MDRVSHAMANLVKPFPWCCARTLLADPFSQHSRPSHIFGAFFGLSVPKVSSLYALPIKLRIFYLVKSILNQFHAASGLSFLSRQQWRRTTNKWSLQIDFLMPDVL